MSHTTGVVWPISHQIDPILRNKALSARILMAKVSAYGGLPLPCLQRVKIRACHQPHPARASRSSPAPQGAGAVMAIPRGKPCPGLHASGNTGMGSQMTCCFVGHYSYAQPPTGCKGVVKPKKDYFNRWVPWKMPRTVGHGDIATGEGTGEGETPAPQGNTHKSLPETPTPPALRAPLPPPGAGAVRGDSHWKAVSGRDRGCNLPVSSGRGLNNA